MKKFISIFIALFTFFSANSQQTDSLDFEISNDKSELLETPVNKVLAPRVLSGYRHLSQRPRKVKFLDEKVLNEVRSQVWQSNVDEQNEFDSISKEIPPIVTGNVIPDWLTYSIRSYKWQDDFIYRLMISNPDLIEYAYWDLPERPQLPEEDLSFLAFVRHVNKTDIKPESTLPVQADVEHTNWLHTLNISLQLSQAYLSGNWYQGGNSYLAFLGNFLWDVTLNQVYHPKTMFQSTVSYKLAINSTPEDKYHKYQISQDLFQYNLKTGYKAYHNWYYSFAMLFKTQFLNGYPVDSPIRSASFLSPGELNLGIGMTYSKENAAKTIKISASISPLSYNLKTCIDKKVDGTQFGIEAGKTSLNEIGSNLEVNFSAKFLGNTTYTTRLFLFSDYKSIETDWENTLNIQFSKLFSTQIYAHLRYDTKADPTISSKWGKLMLKEILSVGLSYNFSTK